MRISDGDDGFVAERRKKEMVGTRSDLVDVIQDVEILFGGFRIRAGGEKDEDGFLGNKSEHQLQ